MELDDPQTLCSECGQLSKLASAQATTPNAQATHLISSMASPTTDADLQARVEELEALIRAAQNPNPPNPRRRARGSTTRSAFRTAAATNPARDAIITLTSDTDSEFEPHFEEDADDADESSSDDELAMLLDDKSVSVPPVPVRDCPRILNISCVCSPLIQVQLSLPAVPIPAPAPSSLNDIPVPEELLTHLYVFLNVEHTILCIYMSNL